MSEHDTLRSPRLQALQNALAQGHDGALSAFWQEIEQQGTPLIESLEDNPYDCLVTFLWRAEEQTNTVVVNSWLTASLEVEGWSPAQHRFAHLSGTDLWYRSYSAPADARAAYQLGLSEQAGTHAEDTPAFHFFADPLSAHKFVLQADPEVGDDEETQSLVVLPAAPSQTWSAERPGIAHGRLDLHSVRSEVLENTRRVWVYTPADYGPQTEYGTLLLFDGGTYASTIPISVILDNLIAARRIPPLIAVLICSLDWETRERELACSPAFVGFLTDELLPWVKQRYAIATNPVYTIVGGSSHGGLAAAYAGMLRPDVFGNVLAQSGSFFWTPPDDNDFEWIARQYVTAATLPRHFYLEVGRFENNPRRSDPGPSELAAVRHLRNILQARGADVRYQEFNSGHDYAAWYGSLADGIIALAGDWPR